MSSSVLKQLRVEFHQMLLKTILTVSNDGISSIADKNNRFSVAVAKGIVQRLGGQNEGVVKAAGQTAGNSFESTCRTFIDHSFHKLLHLRPGAWSVVHLGGRQRSAIASFEQYVHLEDLARILSDHSELAASLGQEYTISPDIVIFRNPYRRHYGGADAKSNIVVSTWNRRPGLCLSFCATRADCKCGVNGK